MHHDPRWRCDSGEPFGDVQIAEDSVLEFPDGLIGLGGQRYALLGSDARQPVPVAAVAGGPDARSAGHQPAPVLRRLRGRVDRRRCRASRLRRRIVGRRVRHGPRGAALDDFTANLQGPDPDPRRPAPPGDQPRRQGRWCCRAHAVAAAAGVAATRRQQAMLRITRRAGERVIVGGEVVIEVLEVRGADRSPRNRCAALGADLPRRDLARGQARERGGCQRAGRAPDVARARLTDGSQLAADRAHTGSGEPAGAHSPAARCSRDGSPDG